MTLSRVFLVGMPGSGKTTLGRRLAEYSGLPAYDLDDLIEAEAQMSVREIFAQRGEEDFRARESEALKHIINQKDDFILSCGGGTPCYHENMKLINTNGCSVFLEVPVPELVRRLKEAEEGVRPLVTEHQDDLEKYLEDLLAHRGPYYQEATLTWRSGDSLEDLATELGLSPAV